MALVVPLGFLVNTDDIGNHYGQYNTTSGELLAYVINLKIILNIELFFNFILGAGFIMIRILFGHSYLQ